MKIVFDHQIFALQHYGGISRYIVRLADHLAAIGHETRIVAPLHINLHLAQSVSRHIGIRLPGFPVRAAPLLLTANRILLNAQSATPYENPDLIHETYYTDRPVNLPGTSMVVTVFDMIHERMRHFFHPHDATSQRKRNTIARANHLVAISHSTKHDLCELFDTAPEKISVVHLGFEPMQSRGLEVSTPTGRPFLLYVGQRQGYKNFSGLLRAVGSDPDLRSTYDVVAFGGPPLASSERQMAVNAGLRADGLHYVSGDDSVLAACYSSAAAFVYPSLYEGFGLPPLEAMSCECPVVSSNTSSMPEVIGDAAEFFDPGDNDSIIHAIKTVLSDTQRRRQLVQAGVRRLEAFSWDKCARETAAAYDFALTHR